jgi:hypothetical protein
VLLAFLVSLTLFSTPRIWLWWVDALRTQPEDIIPVAHGNFSPAMLVLDRFGLRISPYLMFAFGLPALVAVYASAAGTPRAPLPPADPPEEIRAEVLAASAGLLMYLLSVKLVWLHYMLTLVPALLLLLSSTAAPAWRRWRTGLAVLALLLLMVNPARHGLGITAAFPQGCLVAAGVLLLFILVLVELRLTRPHAAG